MKKALLLSVALLWTASALWAAPANANFSSAWGVPFQLIFDGQPQSRSGGHVVHIDRLTPGFHWAEFLIPNGNGRVTTLRARVVLDGGLESSYVLLARPGSGVQLRKVGQVPIRRGYSIFDALPYGPPLPTTTESAESAQFEADSVSPTAAYPVGATDAESASRRQLLAQPSPERAVEWTLPSTPANARPEADTKEIAQRTVRTDGFLRSLDGLTAEETRLALTRYTYLHIASPQNSGAGYATVGLSADKARLLQSTQLGAPHGASK